MNRKLTIAICAVATATLLSGVGLALHIGQQSGQAPSRASLDIVLDPHVMGSFDIPRIYPLDVTFRNHVVAG